LDAKIAPQRVIIASDCTFDRPLSLIRVASEAATPELAEALSSTLLQRDVPAICLEGTEATAAALTKRLAPFGHRPRMAAEGLWLFRQEALPAYVMLAANSAEDALAERLALRLLPRVASLIDSRQSQLVGGVRAALTAPPRRPP